MSAPIRKIARPDRVEHLIVVAGHAVFVGNNPTHPEDDANWVLLPYQVGEVATYVSHVRLGVECASADPSSLLVFSGGQTRREAGPRSESQGYWTIADLYNWWGDPLVALRATTEEFARDSYENLTFSICRFREWTGGYPTKITIVSWPFKQRRFEAHRAALKIRGPMFEFVGFGEPSDIAAAESGEARALDSFSKDPYGTRNRGQRAHRNPFNRFNPYATSCPELRPLLLTPEEADPSALPWA